MRVASERGSAAVEMVLVTPLLLVLLLLMVLLGRFAVARTDLDGAARDAARAASLGRSFPSAETAARSAAEAVLASRDVTCRSVDVVVDADFSPGGWVAAEVSCTLDLGELSLLAVPGTTVMSSRFVSPLETYRGLT
jgi:Flp pilus assembly protein TadG